MASSSRRVEHEKVAGVGVVFVGFQFGRNLLLVHENGKADSHCGITMRERCRRG